MIGGIRGGIANRAGRDRDDMPSGDYIREQRVVCPAGICTSEIGGGPVDLRDGTQGSADAQPDDAALGRECVDRSGQHATIELFRCKGRSGQLAEAGQYVLEFVPGSAIGSDLRRRYRKRSGHTFQYIQLGVLRSSPEMPNEPRYRRTIAVNLAKMRGR